AAAATAETVCSGAWDVHTVTSAPRSRSRTAAVSPMMPPPTTITSATASSCRNPMLSTRAQSHPGPREPDCGMDTNPQPKVTTAFYVQSVASFALSLPAVAAGIVYLP